MCGPDTEDLRSPYSRSFDKLRAALREGGVVNGESEVVLTETPCRRSQGLFILVSPGHPVLFCHSEQSEESKVLAHIAFLRYSDEVPDEGFQILRFAQNDIC